MWLWPLQLASNPKAVCEGVSFLPHCRHSLPLFLRVRNTPQQVSSFLRLMHGPQWNLWGQLPVSLFSLTAPDREKGSCDHSFGILKTPSCDIPVHLLVHSCCREVNPAGRCIQWWEHQFIDQFVSYVWNLISERVTFFVSICLLQPCMGWFGSPMSVFCCQSSPIDVLITPWRRLKPGAPKHWCELSKSSASCPCRVELRGKGSQGTLSPAERGPIVPWHCCANTCCAGTGEKDAEGSSALRYCVFGRNFAILSAVQGRAGADSVNCWQRWWQSNTDTAPEQGKPCCYLLQKQNWQPLERKTSFNMAGQMGLLFKHQ